MAISTWGPMGYNSDNFRPLARNHTKPLFSMMYEKCKIILFLTRKPIAVAAPGFPPGGGLNPPGVGWGREHKILPNSPKNCMKLKEFGRPGGGGGGQSRKFYYVGNTSSTPSACANKSAHSWSLKPKGDVTPSPIQGYQSSFSTTSTFSFL